LRTKSLISKKKKLININMTQFYVFKIFFLLIGTDFIREKRELWPGCAVKKKKRKRKQKMRKSKVLLL
jgi:hypothetical protein